MNIQKNIDDYTDELLTDNYPSNKEALFISISQYSQKPVEESDVFQTLPCEAPDIFHSAEDMRNIHKQAIDARADVFRQLTQLQNYSSVTSLDNTDSLNCFDMGDLENEFSEIKDNEKVVVFIEELDQLIANLCEQKPVSGEQPNKIERLIEFKSSIHLIKLLSEMMQASHLTQFSQTVIEFLDDLVDGIASLTADVIERLTIVVNCYDHYNYSIKIR